MTDSDPFGLVRFAEAQSDTFDGALAELKGGQKVGHWMWFMFPQIAGLGESYASRRYAIRSIEEARAYLDHEVLGPRLVESCEAILSVDGKSAHEILHSPDDMKLSSSATLFAEVSGPESIFHRVLDRFYDGQKDEKTLEILTTLEFTP
jgi:uncharacterized protein (DUF1810 family)